MAALCHPEEAAEAAADPVWMALTEDSEIHVWRAATSSPPMAHLHPQTFVIFHYQLWGSDDSAGAPRPPPVDLSTLGPPIDATGLRGHPVSLCLANVQDALRLVIRNMRAGDITWARIPGQRWVAAAAAAASRATSSTPPSTLLVRVEVCQCTSLAAHTLATATRLKKEGTNAFRNENWSRAVACYKAALRFVLDAHDVFDPTIAAAYMDSGKEVHALRTTLHLNIASCHMNRGAPLRAANRCNKALALDPKNCKGLMRRAKAWTSVGRHGRAVDDLESAQKILQEQLSAAGQERNDADDNYPELMAAKIAKLLERAKRKKKTKKGDKKR